MGASLKTKDLQYFGDTPHTGREYPKYYHTTSEFPPKKKNRNATQNLGPFRVSFLYKTETPFLILPSAGP